MEPAPAAGCRCGRADAGVPARPPQGLAVLPARLRGIGIGIHIPPFPAPFPGPFPVPLSGPFRALGPKGREDAKARARGSAGRSRALRLR